MKKLLAVSIMSLTLWNYSGITSFASAEVYGSSEYQARAQYSLG